MYSKDCHSFLFSNFGILQDMVEYKYIFPISFKFIKHYKNITSFLKNFEPDIFVEMY